MLSEASVIISSACVASINGCNAYKRRNIWLVACRGENRMRSSSAARGHRGGSWPVAGRRAASGGGSAYGVASAKAGIGGNMKVIVIASCISHQ